MTAIVGIRCKDGVVIGADSSATSADASGLNRIIEQQTDKKIELIGSGMIVAGTGAIGLGQRFVSVATRIAQTDGFKKGNALSIGRMLSKQAIEDFALTHALKLDYGALVAYVAEGQAELCELPGGGLHAEVLKWMPMAFQPELKRDLWWASTGSGQPLTDPFLALLRKVFWPTSPPPLAGGIFMAMWALMHACELNPGGINEPIHIATLSKRAGAFTTRFLDDGEKAEHRDMISNAIRHMASFKAVAEGAVAAAPPAPVPPPVQAPQTPASQPVATASSLPAGLSSTKVLD